MNIGQAIKAYRETQNLDIRSMAKTLGINIATLSRIEHGKPCSQNTLMILLEALFGKGKTYVDNSMKDEYSGLMGTICPNCSGYTRVEALTKTLNCRVCRHSWKAKGVLIL